MADARPGRTWIGPLIGGLVSLVPLCGGIYRTTLAWLASLAGADPDAVQAAYDAGIPCIMLGVVLMTLAVLWWFAREYQARQKPPVPRTTKPPA